MSENISQLPDDDEPMTWESTPTLSLWDKAQLTVGVAKAYADMPAGTQKFFNALLDVQLAQVAELRRIASAVERIANQKAK